MLSESDVTTTTSATESGVDAVHAVEEMVSCAAYSGGRPEGEAVAVLVAVIDLV